MLPDKFLSISKHLIWIWFGQFLVLFIIYGHLGTFFIDLPTLFEENAFAKKKYDFKIIILEGFSLFDAKYLLLKIQLIYLMAGWVTLMDNALSNYPRQCAHCWHTLPTLSIVLLLSTGSHTVLFSIILVGELKIQLTFFLNKHVWNCWLLNGMNTKSISEKTHTKGYPSDHSDFKKGQSPDKDWTPPWKISCINMHQRGCPFVKWNVK